ncbi:tetratricopeptide repeat protein [Pontibacter sp. CAU 1760]
MAGLALLLGIYHYFTGNDLAFGWDRITDLQVVPVPVHEVTRLLEPFTLTADGFLLFEQYDVALPTINTMAATMALGILGACLAFYGAAISTMRQLPYFGAVLLLMLFLATFNFSLLGGFGGSSQTLLLISIAVLATLSYGFQSFWQGVTFSLRLLAMLVAVLLIGVIAFQSAQLPPNLVTLHLVNYSSIGVLVATVLFMLWVAYENVNALLWINTQAKTPERRFSMWQFILISVLYLLNLLLLYLRNVGYLKLDIFYINGYVILLLSAVAGFWGMRQREAYYKGLFPFRPTGAILYLVFATIAFLSIGYAFATANDSLTVFYHDMIVYTHLAFGLGFFLYIMINFGRLIDQRLPVYKVVYEPKSFSLFSFALMSLIVCAILVMRTQYRVYFQVQAGYYNYLGDLYTASDNSILAERFYEESDVYDANNVKANYSLAAQHRQQQQPNDEILRLKDAIDRRPNPKLYIRLANLYDDNQYFFEKLYVLQQGAEKFPESGALYNNLALLYAQTSVQDSVEYYFDLAQRFTDDEDFVRSNRLAYYTRQAMLEPAKAVLKESDQAKRKSLRSNMAALRQLLGLDPQTQETFMPDSLQEIGDFTLFYNETLSRLNKGDTTRLEGINAYLEAPGNQMFYANLLFLKGLVHHYNGLPQEGRRVVENLALQSERNSGYYYNTLGQWMLEEQNYLAAAAYFKQAKDHGYPQAYLSQGYALALANRLPEAVQALEEVGYTENEDAIRVAQDLAEVLQQDVKTIVQEVPDLEKVQYLLARLPFLTEDEVNRLVQAITDKDLKRRALVARVDYLIGKEKWVAAYKAMKEASPQLQPEGELRSALNLQQLKVWLNTKMYDALFSKMDKLYLTDRDKRLSLYFKARIAEAKGRTEEAAVRYEQALKMLPYDEETVLAAARFYADYKPESERAYRILLQGITYNPYAASLQKAYALESLDQGLFSYAEQAQENLRNLLPPAEYATFNGKLEQKRQEIAARAEDWQQ